MSGSELFSDNLIPRPGLSVKGRPGAWSPRPRLAQTSLSPQVTAHYANLAKTWLTLAGDLEDNIDAQSGSEPEKKKTG
jgi:hypothetical protein